MDLASKRKRQKLINELVNNIYCTLCKVDEYIDNERKKYNEYIEENKTKTTFEKLKNYVKKGIYIKNFKKIDKWIIDDIVNETFKDKREEQDYIFMRMNILSTDRVEDPDLDGNEFVWLDVIDDIVNIRKSKMIIENILEK